MNSGCEISPCSPLIVFSAEPSRLLPGPPDFCGGFTFPGRPPRRRLCPSPRRGLLDPAFMPERTAPVPTRPHRLLLYRTLRLVVPVRPATRQQHWPNRAVCTDLATVFAITYERGRCARSIDYTQPPPDLPPGRRADPGPRTAVGVPLPRSPLDEGETAGCHRQPTWSGRACASGSCRGPVPAGRPAPAPNRSPTP
jgi:hypothetical protein